MNAKQLFFIARMPFRLGLCGASVAQVSKGNTIQITEIEIDLAHLEDYKAAVREHIEAAIRVEPEVLRPLLRIREG